MGQIILTRMKFIVTLVQAFCLPTPSNLVRVDTYGGLIMVLRLCVSQTPATSASGRRHPRFCSQFRTVGRGIRSSCTTPTATAVSTPTQEVSPPPAHPTPV